MLTRAFIAYEGFSIIIEFPIHIENYHQKLDYHSCSFQLAEQLFDPFSILHSFLDYDLEGLVRIGSLGTNPT